MPLEREIKLRFDSAEAARAAVEASRATPVKPRRLQCDALFDTAERALSARSQVLRVRIEEGRSFITFKTPTFHPTLKVREELETAVEDGDRLATILVRAGFDVWFRYEKYREEFALEGALVAVDETPVGTFIEIEGTDDAIAAAAQALGREPSDYVIDSYRTLFARFCEERGLAATHMVFEAR